jgi:hypothetical protein
MFTEYAIKISPIFLHLTLEHIAAMAAEKEPTTPVRPWRALLSTRLNTNFFVCLFIYFGLFILIFDYLS